MATARFETAAQIAKDAAAQLGLPVVADPLASTEVAQVRLCGCLNAAGRELVQMYRWPHLRKVCDITAATGDGRAWTVPADFAGMVPDTFWNQTTDERICGPITADEWQEYEAEGDTPASPSFRLIQGVVAVIPTSTVTDGDLLQYEYHGKGWVSATGGTVPTDDRATTGTDIVYFDSLLMHWALRRAWLISNGQDTSAAEVQYQRAVDRCKSAETISRPLPLVGSSGFMGPLTPARNWTV